MIAWEDRNTFTLALQEVSSMAQRLEEIGCVVIDTYNEPKCTHEAEGGRYWFKHNKVWEYPFVDWWLRELSSIIGKESLKVMDFGCWICPFPQYLTSLGHEVWGVDDDSWGHMAKCNVATHYPDVSYFMDDVRNLDEGGFDAIFSCSVFEHIMPDELRVELMRKLRSMLAPGGAMVHVVDFYFPGKQNRDGQRMNFYGVAKEMGWRTGDPQMCPGSPLFHFHEARKVLSKRFIREGCEEARIAIGDDIWGE